MICAVSLANFAMAAIAVAASFTKEVTLVGDMGPDETSYVDHLPSRTVLYHYRVYAIATTHMLNN